VANQEIAKNNGYIHCLNCYLLNKVSETRTRDQENRCARCGLVIHSRKPNAIEKTWAYTLTAMILLVPANVYPVMTVIYLDKGEPNTIMSGVIALIDEGMYPIAILVFIASIAVPLFCIITLLFVVHFKWRLSPRQCTLMYRMVEYIGRWSMLDLFITSILVTLVDLGKVATITAGVGATAFASVVVLTILAAKSFDPRLIWDSQAYAGEKHT